MNPQTVSFATALSDIDRQLATCDNRKQDIAEKIARLVLESSENDAARQAFAQKRNEIVAARNTNVYTSYTEYQEYLMSQATMAKVNARREALEKEAREKEAAAHAKVAKNVKEHWDHYVACCNYLWSDSDSDSLQLEKWLKLSSAELENKWEEMNNIILNACSHHRDNLVETSTEILDCPSRYCDIPDYGPLDPETYDEDVGCGATANSNYRTNGCGCKIRFEFHDYPQWWLYYDLKNDSLRGRGYLELR